MTPTFRVSHLAHVRAGKEDSRRRPARRRRPERGRRNPLCSCRLAEPPARHSSASAWAPSSPRSGSFDCPDRRRPPTSHRRKPIAASTLWRSGPSRRARGAAGKAVDAYSEARHRERHADSAANAREWGRIAMAVARLMGKRIGIDTGTRMAANADFTSEPKGRSFTISPILSGSKGEPLPEDGRP